MMNLKSPTPFVQRALFILLGGLIASSQPNAAEKARPIRLVITGNLMGAIRDCRCPHGQPGGLARRKTIFDRIRKETPDAVFIDCGSLTDARMRRVELQLMEELLVTLDYNLLCPYLIDFRRMLDSANYVRVPLNFANYLDLEWLTRAEKMDGWPLGPDPGDLDIVPTFKIGAAEITITTFTAFADDDTTYPNPLIRLDSEGFWDGSSCGGTEFHSRPMWVSGSGLTAYVRNLLPGEEERTALDWLGFDSAGAIPKDYIRAYDDSVGTFLENPDSALWLDKPDLLIIGGGGFVEAEVKKQDGVLVAYPGLYGGYVLVVDLWTEDGKSVSRYEWEAIPTETAAPDSAFNARLTADYKQLEASPGK
jgi:hypothetical protein